MFKGENGQVLTNSLLVAKKFGKEHKHVLDSIRVLIKGLAEISADPLFVETTYVSEQNKQEYPVFVMNKDGFTLLAMGFSGNKALKFRYEYIQAFNEMERKLKEVQKPLSQLEILVQSAQALLEQSRRLDKVEKRLDEIERDRNESGENLLSISITTTRIPEMSVRDKIRQAVNRYASATNTAHSDVWHKIYNTLYYNYKVSINSYKRNKGETLLDVAEKHNLLDKIYNVISSMVSDFQTVSSGKDRIRIL